MNDLTVSQLLSLLLREGHRWSRATLYRRINSGAFPQPTGRKGVKVTWSGDVVHQWLKHAEFVHYNPWLVKHIASLDRAGAEAFQGGAYLYTWERLRGSN